MMIPVRDDEENDIVSPRTGLSRLGDSAGSVAAPEITVITATYNRAGTIARTIASLKRQTFDRFEHIIVDDGSKDETYHLIAEYVRSDPRVVYVRKQNGGAVSAMNTGITLA